MCCNGYDITTYDGSSKKIIGTFYLTNPLRKRGFLFITGIYYGMRELIKKVLKEQSENLSEFYKTNTDTFPSFIRQQLESIYKPIGKWGKAPNPNDDCITDTGVINIFPHSDEDVWSVLNRFDTNSKVKDRLKELFKNSNPVGESEQDLRKWVDENKNDLFGPKGVYTQELVDLNMTTIISGNKNEMFAINVLKNKFPNGEMKRFCSGDIRDTKKGIDIVIVNPSKDITIQVKPFTKTESFVEPDGDTFFEVHSYLDANRYSERIVNIFMYVNSETEEFILFKNKKLKIGQLRGNVTRFYEPPLYTNISFTVKQKRKYKTLDSTEDLFDANADMLKNLEFRKSQIEKMIGKIKKNIVSLPNDSNK